MSDSIIPVQIRFPGIWFLLDMEVKVSLDGKFLGNFSIKKGFNLYEQILPGEHTLSTKIPIRASKQFPFELSKDTAMILTLSYSRTWGDFSGLEITEDRGGFRKHRERIANENEELRKHRAQQRQAMRQKASERERALDYDSAIEIWEDLGAIKEAARVRRLKAKQGTVKVDQTVVHGDYVDDRDTIIKDSVVSKSNVGASGKSKAEEIKEIKELLDSGAIDDDEFKQMKKEILGK